VIDETNSDILDLIGLYPTSVEVLGNLGVGDGLTVVRLDRSATVSGHYALTSPFAFTVQNATIELDPYEVDLDEDLREALAEDVCSVRIRARIENGFPFGAAAVLNFATDSLTVFTNPEITLDPVDAPPAEVDQSSGKTVQATATQDEVALAPDEIQTLAEPDLFLGVQLDLVPSGGVIVVSPTDEVVVSSTLILELTVSEDLFDDGGDDE
jgi:hypothetical protein